MHNHVQDLIACDFFVVPTTTFQGLLVFVILAHERQRIVHFNVTEHPTAPWTAQQMVEAFPWKEAPRYLLRDRIYGESFQQRVKKMGIEEVKIAPRSPWQNPHAERLIGSIRRECLRARRPRVTAVCAPRTSGRRHSHTAPFKGTGGGVHIGGAAW